MSKVYDNEVVDIYVPVTAETVPSPLRISGVPAGTIPVELYRETEPGVAAAGATAFSSSTIEAALPNARRVSNAASFIVVAHVETLP